MNKNDFSKGNIYKHIAAIAVPMTIALLVQMLYNIVDRIYIGHIPNTSSMALTGLGVTFPVITVITAFTNLFAMGGAPLCSIARGKNDPEYAEKIMGCTFFMLCISSAALMLFCYIFMKPMLYTFGAGNESYLYASEYLKIYLIGTPSFMIGTGMNGFINSQGFAKEGMATILIGAVINIILDPIFIFLFKLGISGAAAATIISQLISSVWVVAFLTVGKTILKLKKSNITPNLKIIKRIVSLGMAGFVMQASNGVVQVVCNTTLKSFGGDLYVGIMTVLNSVREVAALPIQGLAHGSQPVLGFNFGAGKFERIKKAVGFITVFGVVYMLFVWLIIFMFPQPIMKVFNSDPNLISKGIPAMHIFFFGFFMMTFQFVGQSVFVGLGQSKQAIFFSMLRKIIIVVPLSLALPYIGGLGVYGVFLAEPVSNFSGAVLCYITMIFTLKKLFKEHKIKHKS